MHRPWVVIFIFNFTQLGMVSYLIGNNFFMDTKSNLRVLFNEICVLAVNYFFISLSDFVRGPEARVWTGTWLINLTSFLIFVNVCYTAIF